MDEKQAIAEFIKLFREIARNTRRIAEALEAERCIDDKKMERHGH